MPYRLSQRLSGGKSAFGQATPPRFDTAGVGKVLLVFSVVSFLTSFFFDTSLKTLVKQQVPLHYVAAQTGDTEDKEEGPLQQALLGPFAVEKANQVVEISISFAVPVQKWAFVEGEVLDSAQQFLFSFSKELWHEKGTDDEGTWEESEEEASLKITFPTQGQYYLRIKNTGDYHPESVAVLISPKKGSSLPHTLFAIGCLVGGIIALSQSRTSRQKTPARK